MKVMEAVETLDIVDVAEAVTVVIMEAVNVEIVTIPTQGPSTIREETIFPSNPQG